MTTMIGEALTWIEIALVLFFVVFVIIVVRVCFARRGTFDDDARIPLDDDPPVTGRDEGATR